MPEESEKVKRLVEFKEKLAEKVIELESELKDLQAMAETLDSILLEKGFRRVEMPKEPIAAKPLPQKTETPIEPEPSILEPPPASENVIPLKTGAGELLAILHITENSLRVLPAGDKSFNVNTPPFTQFLVERVLAKMQERDSEMARAGQLTTDRIFSYNIVREGDIIQEIAVRNVDADRLRELKSSVRWTLEKMYEKMQSEN
jgi:hypothetical protein